MTKKPLPDLKMENDDDDGTDDCNDDDDDDDDNNDNEYEDHDYDDDCDDDACVYAARERAFLRAVFWAPRRTSTACAFA